MRPKPPGQRRSVKLLVETTFDPNGKKPVDIAALDQLVESMPAEGRGNASLFVGWFLKNQGDAKSAKKYLQNCSESPHVAHLVSLSRRRCYQAFCKRLSRRQGTAANVRLKKQNCSCVGLERRLRK